MVNIQLDDNTARALERQAQEAGMSLVEYLRSLVAAGVPQPRPSWESLESEILALSTSGPSLPADFSRADIYGDHD